MFYGELLLWPSIILLIVFGLLPYLVLLLEHLGSLIVNALVWLLLVSGELVMVLIPLSRMTLGLVVVSFHLCFRDFFRIAQQLKATVADVWISSSRAWDLNLHRNLTKLEIVELATLSQRLLSDCAPLLILGFSLRIHL